jgi:tRNA threonylcarbamoyladenosine biosynthesis protein TsaB
MPTILAIETSSELASCALLKDGSVHARESSGVRTHSASVLPMVQELLAEAGVALKDVDAIAFGSGPGSFTGVRTACGIAQGLAFGANLPVVPVVTLPAMALACREQTGASEILTVLDARMGEVYWAQYRWTGDAWLTVSEPVLSAPDAVAPISADGLVACGNGISAYPDAFAGKAFADEARTAILPHAAQVAQLAEAEYTAGRTLSAAQAQPLYLRNKVAYTSAERKVINATKDAA